MANYIIAFIVIVIVISILIYLIREKKKGAKCIGCPYAKQCSDQSCNSHLPQ